MLFFFYKNANVSYLVSHLIPAIQKNTSCMRSMQIFYEVHN